MTPVKLTAFERSDIKNSAIVRAAYIDKITLTLNFFATTNNGDVAWARSRNLAVRIKKQPSMLVNDSDLMNVFELTLIAREFDNKDTDTIGTLEEQFIAYMNDSNRWGFLVDDYYASKNGGLEM